MDGEAITNAGTGAAAGSAFGPYGAAIGAAVGLVGGLLSSSARRAEEERRRKLELQLKGLEVQSQAAKAMTEGEQNAFNQILAGYRSSVVK